MAEQINRLKKLRNLLPLGILASFISCTTTRLSQQSRTASENTPDSILVDLNGNQYTIKQMPDSIFWMTANLKLNIPGSYCYENEKANCEQYGRLYTYEAAQKVCVQFGNGWRLPTDEEWQKLSRHYGLPQDSIDYRKKAYKALMLGGSSSFHAVLGGGRNPDETYKRLEAHGFYWTSTETDSSMAVFYNFAKGSQAVFRQPEGEKLSAFSVRCVKTY
jgi:uncharacterized protein (TIGR02145 family)